MNTNDSVKSTDWQNQPYCTKKFETPAGQIENSFLCGQSRLTSADIWNVRKQRKEFPRRALNSILN